MILLETGGLYAALDANEAVHPQAVEALCAAPPPRLLSPFVLAELDYLIGKRINQKSQLALLAEVTRGAYQLETFSTDDVAHAMQIMERYADLGVGLAVASIVVLSYRHRCLDVLGTDARHFRALRGAGGRSFRLVPTRA